MRVQVGKARRFVGILLLGSVMLLFLGGCTMRKLHREYRQAWSRETSFKEDAAFGVEAVAATGLLVATLGQVNAVEKDWGKSRRGEWSSDLSLSDFLFPDSDSDSDCSSDSKTQPRPTSRPATPCAPPPPKTRRVHGQRRNP